MQKVFAQNLTLPDGTVLDGPVPWASSLGAIINQAIPFLITFATIGLMFMLLMGGFEFLTSAGDAKKLEMGQKRITNAFIGFLLIFGAYWIVLILGQVFNLDAITQIFL